MTYPAWFELHEDPIIRKTPSALSVYAALVGLEGIFFRPRPLKVWVVAEALQLKKQTVSRALDLLVGRGYLTEHDRDEKNVRTFTIALKKATSAPERPHPNAA